ncbi:MAG: hypothetical protein ACD_73C00244G0002 [uncultured bacterium]|nr:MAG: hypothetical protein ACD_73C00244G0002 [uncultured bacterium]
MKQHHIYSVMKLTFMGLVLGGLLAISPIASGQTTTTTVETEVKTETKSKAPAKPAPVVKKPASKKETPKITTTTTVIKETTTPRAVYDQKALQKLADAAALCTKGYDAHVGSNKKNVCQSHAQSPDIAYSCSWREKGPAVYPETEQGPCVLDFAIHHGGMKISKDDYKSGPPLDYGTSVECCYREASGSAKVETSTETYGPK